MRYILPIIIILFAFSCKDDTDANPTFCIRAEYASPDMCSRFVIIKILNGIPIGKSLDYNGQHLNNAIKVVGDVPVGESYFRVRKFNPQTDTHLLGDPVFCLAIFASAAIPEFVVESVSLNGCP